MSLFNDTSPADTDPVNAGASAIRGVETSLNTLLSQIFADDTTFLPGFVTNALLAGDPSNDSLRAVGANNIQTGALTIGKFPVGVFTADSPGRAPFATGFVTTSLLDPAIVLPDGSATEDVILDGAVTVNKIGSGAVTIPKVSAGIAKIAVGTYAGSNSLAVTISGLAFAPTFLVLTNGNASNTTGIAFQAESSGNIGPIHNLWDNNPISSPFTTAITWNSDGFTITPSNHPFNDGGITHSYLALAV